MGAVCLLLVDFLCNPKLNTFIFSLWPHAFCVCMEGYLGAIRLCFYEKHLELLLYEMLYEHIWNKCCCSHPRLYTVIMLFNAVCLCNDTHRALFWQMWQESSMHKISVTGDFDQSAKLEWLTDSVFYCELNIGFIIETQVFLRMCHPALSHPLAPCSKV